MLQSMQTECFFFFLCFLGQYLVIISSVLKLFCTLNVIFCCLFIYALSVLGIMELIPTAIVDQTSVHWGP